MKIFRKVLLYTGLTLGVLFIVLLLSVFLFRDRIINQFITQANKNLNTPVSVGKFDLSIFEEFPQLSIVLSDVYVEDSHPGQYPLLTAKVISFQMNPFEAWRGVYTIHGLQIRDSEVNLKIDVNGNNNYTILKNTGSHSGDSSSVNFELKNVGIQRTTVHYTDINAEQQMTFASRKLIASIHTIKDVYTIDASGELTTEKIDIRRNSFLPGKSFTLKSQLVYDDLQKILTVNPSELSLQHGAFTVKGDYRWRKKSVIDLAVNGSETDIQTLLTLLPESIARNFQKYKSKGDVYFSAKLKGDINKGPALTVDFGFNEATIFHPDYQTKINDASLKGSFASSNVTDSRNAVLILKDIKGTLNDEPFAANFNIHDFKDPEVICDFKGRVDAAAVQGFYPLENIRDVHGSLLADISFEGKIKLLKSKTTAQRVSTRGTIELEKINLRFGKDNIALHDLSGSLQFNNNDLALSNVSATLGNSDFLLNGFFKNVITFLLFENQPIGIETDLKSNFLDIDQLLAIGFGKPSQGENQKYEFRISPDININFNCDVKALQYRRFHGRALKGDLLVKNEVAVSRNINLRTMGGDLAFSGIVDAKNHKAIDVVSTFKLNSIHVDSVFYVFENFDQNFLQDKHLKGQMNADVNIEFTLNQNLKLFPETLVADISTTIKNGELNNFEPLKKLNKYLDDEGLSKLRFSDLKNDIHIEKKTIYIPQMQVRSNVTNISISGTHTFDQQIDYRVVAPLRSKRKIDPQEAQTAIEEESGQTRLYLKIVGTTEDYRVVYDIGSVRKKIAADLKKEVKELKDAFKNKGIKKKEAELEKDAYFEDW